MTKKTLSVILTPTIILTASCNLTGHSNECDDNCNREAIAKAAIHLFEKERSDWEILMSAYSGETKQIGRFSSIGYLPNLKNEYWRVFENENDFGKQYFESKIKIMDCEAGEIFVNTFSLQKNNFSLRRSNKQECLRPFQLYGANTIE